MPIVIATALIGLIAALAAAWAAFRLVPPLQPGVQGRQIESALRAEHEADFLEAVTRAEQERRDEIDALRLMMLQQRLEISKLRRGERERRLRLDPGRSRAQDLEFRRRRASKEARHLDELPAVADHGSVPVSL